MTLEISEYWGLLSIPTIIALLEVAKIWVADKRFYPIIAIILGVAWNVGLARYVQQPIEAGVVVGIIVGLTSAGLYSSVKAVRGL